MSLKALATNISSDVPGLQDPNFDFIYNVGYVVSTAFVASFVWDCLLLLSEWLVLIRNRLAGLACYSLHGASRPASWFSWLAACVWLECPPALATALETWMEPFLNIAPGALTEMV